MMVRIMVSSSTSGSEPLARRMMMVVSFRPTPVRLMVPTTMAAQVRGAAMVTALRPESSRILSSALGDMLLGSWIRPTAMVVRMARNAARNTDLPISRTTMMTTMGATM